VVAGAGVVISVQEPPSQFSLHSLAAHVEVQFPPLQFCVHCFTLDKQIRLQFPESQFWVQVSFPQIISAVVDVCSQVLASLVFSLHVIKLQLPPVQDWKQFLASQIMAVQFPSLHRCKQRSEALHLMESHELELQLCSHVSYAVVRPQCIVQGGCWQEPCTHVMSLSGASQLVMLLAELTMVPVSDKTVMMNANAILYPVENNK